MTEAFKFTFEVPRELRALMDSHPEVNWSAVFREAIVRQSEAMEIATRILEETADPRVQAVAASLKKGVGGRFRRAVG